MTTTFIEMLEPPRNERRKEPDADFYAMNGVGLAAFWSKSAFSKKMNWQPRRR